MSSLQLNKMQRSSQPMQYPPQDYPSQQQQSPVSAVVAAVPMHRTSITENPMRQSEGGGESQYGRLQHEIKQHVRSSGRCCGHTEIDTLALFYESILIVKKSHQETACCCCALPDGYEMMAVPKYKLRSVAIGKEGGDSCCIPLLICCPPHPNYVVSIGLSDEKEKGSKTIWEMAALPQSIKLVVGTEPNSQFLFSYVYGPLCSQGQMKVMHRLSHMINDDLTAKLTPSGFSDLEAH